MSSSTTRAEAQVFKYRIPRKILYDFLKENAYIIPDEYPHGYIVNLETHKRAIIKETLVPFYEACRPYYFEAKQKYLDNLRSGNALLTVIRQICKFHGIEFTTQTRYLRSSYMIHYYIPFLPTAAVS